MKFNHGGNIKKLAEMAGRPEEEILDFSASINPLGPPESLRPVISRTVDRLPHYPDPDCIELTEILAARFDVGTERIVIGNGSTEIIYALPRILDKKRVVLPVPSYLDYDSASCLAGLEVETLVLWEGDGFELDWQVLANMLNGDEIVFCGQPNNPTGLLLDRDRLLALAGQYPDTIFVIDESFAGFVEGYQTVASEKAPANLIMVSSLTKFYAIAGLRLGFAVVEPDLAIRLRSLILPWSVNTMAQAVGTACLADSEYAKSTRKYVSRCREQLHKRLEALPALRVFPGAANFLLVKIVKSGLDAPELAARLLEQGIAIRVCENFQGLDKGFFRVAVRTEEENNRLCEALEDILGSRKKKPGRAKTSALMLQGTASNAGKSILTAALCRIFLQDGIHVAPFKAQNMSLNSFVTKDGLEMGRAQVVQAQACRLDPDVRMNPVLLKPSGDRGCQVIVHGKPVGNQSVTEYIDYKTVAWPAVCEAYDSLAAENELVVLEGAGSPGEVNLKHHDIVNMRMARYAKSPVLLVGDIDRGGVFASFIGTMEVLAEWERSLVAGFVVNRFRGKQSLLGDAFHYTENHTGRPVFGVVPYLEQLGLPEEDSVSFKAGLYDAPAPPGEHVEIGLIDLPHISNFTDFEPFLTEPDVHLRIIRNAADLEAFKDGLAAIFLPGSKNVNVDMEYLTGCGLGDLVRHLAGTGRVEVIGICGGFQMLGKTITDPHALESDGRGSTGLGLLDIYTTLEESKALTRRVETHESSGLKVHGYEIHHGRTVSKQKPVLKDIDGDRICAATEDGMVWGSYLHGIFDADEFRRWFIDRLRQSRGLVPLVKVQTSYDIEPAIERLADVVRSSLDMKRIYKLIDR